MACTVYAFDAYGTIFDVHAAARRHAPAMGEAASAFSALWRTKQLEYTWVRTLAGRYLDFWTLTEQALDFAFAAFPSVDRSLRQTLLDAYLRLDCFPEAPEVLTALKAQGKRLAILSNGTPAMLQAALAAAGLENLFEAVISVDALRAYKTDQRVYELPTAHFRVYPEAVSFQSSNRWDVAAAAAFGLRAIWINRAQVPDEYADLRPAAVLPSLAGLLRL
jgi:2-haloacid dehalogenase